jgi:hypothetical protein
MRGGGGNGGGGMEEKLGENYTGTIIIIVTHSIGIHWKEPAAALLKINKIIGLPIGCITINPPNYVVGNRQMKKIKK